MAFAAFSAAIDDRAKAFATPMLSQMRLGRTAKGGIVSLASKYANRHGLITGATGSGKTCSLVRLASEFNRVGVPVFAPDMKGDLTAFIEAGIPAGVPAVQLVPGVNFRLSLRRLGGDLAARALGLTDAQRGALDGYLDAGCESPAAIKRFPVRLAQAASERCLARRLDRLDSNNFGGNSFDIADLVVKPSRVHVLQARDIAEQGSTYAAFMTYLLRDLYQRLPEVGDRALPVLAFFVDEAHMLFQGAPADLVSELERMVRLIRSRGVSLWFVTQSPADLPDTILAQLQNRIQHSLRAVTPKDWRGVRAAVDSMPAGDFADPVKLLGTLAPGKALVSLVGSTGIPQATELCTVDAPEWSPYAPSSSTTDAAAFRCPVATPAERVAVVLIGTKPAARRMTAAERATLLRALQVLLWIVAGFASFGLALFVLMLSIGLKGGRTRR